MDSDSFDDDWRDWIDNPPLNWSPPLDATLIWTTTFDSRTMRDPNLDNFFYIVRADAWPSKDGLAMHFRTVHVFLLPVEGTEKWRAYFKKSVTSFVIAWHELATLREWFIDPSNPHKPNGKGGKHDWDDKL
jgi:hypothetical protein